MSTTTITGTIHGVNNSALANKWISFRLVELGTDSTATVTVAQSVDSVQTDSNGDFSIDIWDNGTSGKKSVLEITVEGSRAEFVIIPEGTASIELWDLIENYQADGSTSEQVPVVSDLFLRKSTNLSDLGDAPTARTNLGVEIGTDVQAHSATLDATTASFTTADESKLDGIEALADVTDATNIAASGGYVAGGTDVALTDGGTGASDAPTARTNLGVPSTAEAVLVANNLSDVDPVTARANLGVPSTQEGLSAANNLSELTPTSSTARTNIGVAIGSDVQAHSAVLDATTASFTAADETKLDGIEALADVTDSTNILAAGGYVTGTTVVPIADGGTGATTAAAARAALGVPASSEGLVASNNLSDVGDVAISRTNLGLDTSATTPASNYATAAQGVTADNAIPTSGIGSSVQAFSTFLANTTAAFTETQRVKLAGIEDLADVTNATNVVSAGGYVAGVNVVALTDGGTGASTATTARTNLGFQSNAATSVTPVTTTSYTVFNNDSVLTVDDTAIGGNVTINLLSAVTVGSGWTLDVKKTGSSFSVTIDADGTETIDGNLTLSITDKNQAVRLISNGTNWDILSPHNINGWAIYDDLASATTPVVVNNTKHQITIDGSGPTNNVTYLPVGISSLWDTTSNKIIPAKLGDAYDIRVDFKIEPTNINDYANFILDIGTVVAPNPIINRSLTFLKTGISSFSIGFPIAAIQEFITNGGRMFIDTSVSTSNVSISDVDLFIKRDFATL